MLNLTQDLIDSINNEWFFYYLKDVINNENDEYSQYSSMLLNIFENLPSMNPNLTVQERARINLSDFKFAVQVTFTYGDEPDFRDSKKDQMDSYIARIKPSLALLSSLYDNKSDIELDMLEEIRKDLSYITDNYSLRSDMTISEIQTFITKYSDYFSLADLEELYMEIFEQKRTFKIIQRVKDMEISSDSIASDSNGQELEEQEKTVSPQDEIVLTISESLISEHPELDYEETDEIEQTEIIALGFHKKISILANIIYREIENIEERQQKIDDYIKKIEIIKNIFSNFNDCIKEYRNLYEKIELFEKLNTFTTMMNEFNYSIEILSELSTEDEIEDYSKLLVETSLNINCFDKIIELKEELDEAIKQKSTGDDEAIINSNDCNIVVLLPEVVDDLIELCQTADAYDTFFGEFKERIRFMREHDCTAIEKYYRGHSYDAPKGVVSVREFPKNLYFGQVARNYHQTANICRIVGSCDRHKEINRDILFEHYGIGAKIKSLYSIHELYDKKDAQKSVKGSSKRSSPVAKKGYSRYTKHYRIYYSLLQKDVPWTLEEQQQVFEFIDKSNELLDRILKIETYDDFKTFVESYRKQINLGGGAK